MQRCGTDVFTFSQSCMEQSHIDIGNPGSFDQIERPVEEEPTAQEEILQNLIVPHLESIMSTPLKADERIEINSVLQGLIITYLGTSTEEWPAEESPELDNMQRRYLEEIPELQDLIIGYLGTLTEKRSAEESPELDDLQRRYLEEIPELQGLIIRYWWGTLTEEWSAEKSRVLDNLKLWYQEGALTLEGSPKLHKLINLYLGIISQIRSTAAEVPPVGEENMSKEQLACIDFPDNQDNQDNQEIGRAQIQIQSTDSNEHSVHIDFPKIIEIGSKKISVYTLHGKELNDNQFNMLVSYSNGCEYDISLVVTRYEDGEFAVSINSYNPNPDILKLASEYNVSVPDLSNQKVGCSEVNNPKISRYDLANFYHTLRTLCSNTNEYSS